MVIGREILSYLDERLFQGKALIIMGARQTGKTTLVKMLLQNINRNALFFNGDEPDIREMLSNVSSTRLKSLIGDKEIVVIDEAQRIVDVGLTIKLIVDILPDVQVIATGSSSFELSGMINEPLTGRKYEMILLPVSFSEMVSHSGLIEEKRLLEHRLVYGCYPEIIKKAGQEKELLHFLADSYLYKDLFLLEQIKKPQLLEKIVKALAFQVGNEVSYNEIANLIGADNQTVEKYIDKLEKAFVVFRLNALSRNMRNEIKRRMKVYFWDNGIRNSLISNFTPVQNRTDAGNLWENYVVSERKKYINNKIIYANSYFWRTTQKQEIDYIEEVDGRFYAYEIKWGKSKRNKQIKSFMDSYEVDEIETINRENIESFLV